MVAEAGKGACCESKLSWLLLKDQVLSRSDSEGQAVPAVTAELCLVAGGQLQAKEKPQAVVC